MFINTRSSNRNPYSTKACTPTHPYMNVKAMSFASALALSVSSWWWKPDTESGPVIPPQWPAHALSQCLTYTCSHWTPSIFIYMWAMPVISGHTSNWPRLSALLSQNDKGAATARQQCFIFQSTFLIEIACSQDKWEGLGMEDLLCVIGGKKDLLLIKWDMI